MLSLVILSFDMLDKCLFHCLHMCLFSSQLKIALLFYVVIIMSFKFLNDTGLLLSAWRMLKLTSHHFFNVSFWDIAKKLQGSVLSHPSKLVQKINYLSKSLHHCNPLFLFSLRQLSRYHKRVASYVTSSVFRRIPR